MVCRCCGGIVESGSADVVRARAGRTVLVVFVRAYEGRAVVVVVVDVEAAGLSKREARLFVLDARGSRGDFVGESGILSIVGLNVLVAARVLIHERSSAEALAGVNGFVGDVVVGAKIEGVDCFSGDPDGVPARTVEGDCPEGESGLLNGDMRPLLLRPKDSGAGLSCPGEFACI